LLTLETEQQRGAKGNRAVSDGGPGRGQAGFAFDPEGRKNPEAEADRQSSYPDRAQELQRGSCEEAAGPGANPGKAVERGFERAVTAVRGGSEVAGQER
jgi:hypothetical protein